jgi:ABC-type multidrug transport system fused ATPase/permease subunit
MLYSKIVNLPISYFLRNVRDVVPALPAMLKKWTVFLSVLELIKEPLNILLHWQPCWFSVNWPFRFGIYSFQDLSFRSSGSVEKAIGQCAARTRLFLVLAEKHRGLKVIKGFNAEERMEGSSMQAHNVITIANQLELRKGLASQWWISVLVIGTLLMVRWGRWFWWRYWWRFSSLLWVSLTEFLTRKGNFYLWRETRKCGCWTCARNTSYRKPHQG